MQAPRGDAESAAARFVTTRASKILTVDTATAKLLQRGAHLLVGKPLAVLIAVDQRQEFRARLATLPAGSSVADWHLQLHAQDGSPIPVIAIVEAVEGDAEESSLHWAIVRDPAAALPEPVSQPGPAADPFQDLLDDLVHEVNQPLAAIVGFARGCVLRARSENLPLDALENAMEHIVTEASRAGTLLRNSAERWKQERS